MSLNNDDFEFNHPFKVVFDSPVDDEELRRAEQSIGCEFPDEYVRFLRKCNGVLFFDYSPRFHLLDEEDEDEYESVALLYGIFDAAHSDDLRKHVFDYDFKWRVPNTVVAIGDDGSWDRICLSVAPGSFGRVLFWRPGEPWEYTTTNEGHVCLRSEDNIVNEEHLHPVANDFVEFWKMLEPNSEF